MLELCVSAWCSPLPVVHTSRSYLCHLLLVDTVDLGLRFRKIPKEQLRKLLVGDTAIASGIEPRPSSQTQGASCKWNGVHPKLVSSFDLCLSLPVCVTNIGAGVVRWWSVPICLTSSGVGGVRWVQARARVTSVEATLRARDKEIAALKAEAEAVRANVYEELFKAEDEVG